MAGVFAACRTMMAKNISKGAGNSGGGLVTLDTVVPVSEALAQFLGATHASRNAALEKIHEHLKSHNLPMNQEEFQCDDKLKTIFDGKDVVKVRKMDKMGKILSKHFPPL